MDVAAAVADLDLRLRAQGDPGRAADQKRYLKSDLDFIGLPVPLVRRTTKAWAKDLGGPEGDAMLDLAEALWADPVFERRLAAVELIILRFKTVTLDHVPRIESLLRECRTWALLDPLAAYVGSLLDGPAGTPTLDRWAADDDFWMRRSALLAHLGPLRDGGGEFERFARYAEAMLDEKEFFVRKAIGWVLRDTSRKRPAIVGEWVVAHATRMSGVTFREAVKYLDPETVSEATALRAS